MKSDRLLSTLLLLQSHGRMTGRELSKKLEVSLRTIHRDMDALSAAGVPVYALRGAQGGWQLDPDWRTEVPALDDAELHALLMTQPRMIGDARLAAAADGAIRKLMAAMPGAQRDKAAGIRQRLYVDPTGWFGGDENLATLPTVQEAVARDLKLSMKYKRTGKDEVERVVDPLGLVAKGMVWYLVAHTPNGFRTYRVSRILQADVLNESCERPRDFDLAAYWESATNEFRGTKPKFQVILRTDTRTAQWIRLYRAATTFDEHEESVTLSLGFGDLDEAQFVVLGLGPRAEVLEPAELRERVTQAAIQMVQRFGFRLSACDTRPVSGP